MSVTTSVAEEVFDIYADLQSDVAERSARYEERIPDDVEIFDLHHFLDSPPNRWRDDEKALRTVPVVATYQTELGHELNHWQKQVLTGMDVIINSADDTIDKKYTDKFEDVELQFNNIQGHRLAYQNIPEEYMDTVGEAVGDYLTTVFLIPQVEPVMVDKVRHGDNEQEAAKNAYDFRAEDIDGFSRIPGLVEDMDESTYENIVDDLHAYRARQLIFDDVWDIEEDLKQEDPSIVIALAEKYGDAETVSNQLENLYDNFSYSDDGGAYQSELQALERQPEDLTDTISEKMSLIEEYNTEIQ